MVDVEPAPPAAAPRAAAEPAAAPGAAAEPAAAPRTAAVPPRARQGRRCASTYGGRDSRDVAPLDEEAAATAPVAPAPLPPRPTTVLPPRPPTAVQLAAQAHAASATALGAPAALPVPAATPRIATAPTPDLAAGAATAPEAPTTAPAIAAPFLLASGDLTNAEALKAYAAGVVAGGRTYFEGTLLVKRAAQLERMKLARIFDVLHVVGNPATSADVERLVAFNFVKNSMMDELPKLIKEIPSYTKRANDIKPLEERLVKGAGTFCHEDWWYAAQESNEIPVFCKFVRKMLCNSPNSCAPERVFSILDDTFGDDQRRAFADYMELSLVLQFNERGRSQKK